MKKILLTIVILLIAAAAVLEFRYALVVDSPVVAKLDRLTGDTWIVNAGVWLKVKDEEPRMGIKRILTQASGSETPAKVK